MKNITGRKRFSKGCCALALMAMPLMSPATAWAGDLMGQGAALQTELLTANAQQEMHYFFQVLLKNGETVTIPFAEKPVMRMTATECNVKSEKVDMTIPFDELDRFVLVQKDDPTAIDPTVMQQEEMHRNGDLFAFSNCRAGSAVFVFDRSGRMVAKANADENGRCEVSLEGQPAGMYVIKSEFVNCKVLKK